jgi:hypothetical protein
MGMGNYADYADCIERDFVKKICPDEYDEFLIGLDEQDISFDEFCISLNNQVNFDSSEEYEEYFGSDKKVLNCYKSWLKLKYKFNEITELSLYVVHHEADDRGDDLDGGSFAVDGVYELTPAGKKYKNKIERKTWTNFG